MITDPISDYLTSIRNALKANHRIVEIPASNTKKNITKILYDHGYILKYKFEEDNKQGVIKIALKYNQATKEPLIKFIRKISKPGKRVYHGASDIPRVMNGLGIAIVSTSRGLMTDKEARSQKIGGEVLCEVF